MASREEVTLPAPRHKSRKSLSHILSSRTMDQENMTADLGALANGKRAMPIAKASKKLRSKSIGPGGLDALTDASGNRRKSLATIAQPPPKSILKPTMPFLREIPAHVSTRKGSPKKATPPSDPRRGVNVADSGTKVTGADDLPNPFQIEGSAAVNETRVTLRSEEEQQAAAREREEKERQKQEKEAMSRRDARRKSLANRRVSFAPEATLHTWDVVVEYQDSTTSSNGTRRASSASGGSVGSPHPRTTEPPSSDPSEPPSTPPEQVEEEKVAATPENKHDLHQKKRRRSSGIPPMNFNNPDDDFLSSSPFSGDSPNDEDDVDEDEDVALASNSDSGDDDGTTMMSLDAGETTDMSIASVTSDSTSGSSSRLNEALQEAARQAGTYGNDFYENVDDGSPEEDEEVVASFAPWPKKESVENIESREDQENINHFAQKHKLTQLSPGKSWEEDEITMDMTSAVGGILTSHQIPEEEELSMDVTRAFGNIISNEVPQIFSSAHKPAAGRRQSTRRRSSADEASLDDETMDLTMVVGGIQLPQQANATPEDEDVTMEFTSVVGGVLGQVSGVSRDRRRSSVPNQRKLNHTRRESSGSNHGDETMEMTMAVGGIMPPITESDPDKDDTTMGMDITTAVGGILVQQPSIGSQNGANHTTEMKTNIDSSPLRAEILSNSPPMLAGPVHTVASETGSPSLTAFRGKGLRRSTGTRNSTTPKPEPGRGGTPNKKPATPSKQITPQQPRRPTTPGKTPPSKGVVMRTASPKRLFRDEIKDSSTPQSASRKGTTSSNKLFQQDKATGVATPSFILTPKQRRSSGLGFDKAGLGSPRLAQILDRRRSIGEQAKAFLPNQSKDEGLGLRFDDPRALENEIDNERAQAEAKENGRMILEREVNQPEETKDATINLKEMIQSLTPKKRSLKGRKSLHVGAATGVLGKRPAELDEEDEDEDEGGIKRLKGHMGSPVKNVKLRGPPSKAETTGRLTRAARKSLEEANTLTVTPTISSSDNSDAITPRNQGRFKDAEAGIRRSPIAPPSEKEPVEDPKLDEKSFSDERIQLQDFLNMTSIRFMELTTTKRRHTIAPRSSTKDLIDDTPATLEDCVAAGAATIPMLELFQHACQELKNYISEGRKTVREIETETFEENPPLFQEYISATPDMKIFMDNQLKNVKTHARLLSKATWYEWRMTLLGTLKDGLFRSAEGMIHDEEILDEQQALIETTLPQLILEAEKLQQEEFNHRTAAEELAKCDPEELGNARHHLITIDADVEAKKRTIEDLRRLLREKEAEIEAGTERKRVCLEDIQEAEKIREECRGWASSEICVLKDRVEAIEKEHGWTITGVSGPTISMTYRNMIELVFNASAFLSQCSAGTQLENSRLDLWYIGASRELNPLPLTLEKDSFLQTIRDRIRGLSQAQTSIKNLLQVVSSSWDKAAAVVENLRLLKTSCPTEVTKTSDNSILIKSSLLIGHLATKVEIAFHLISTSTPEGIEVEISPNAKVIYGERFNEPKMGEFLLSRIGNSVEAKGQATKVAWGAAVAELGAKLLARGRK